MARTIRTSDNMYFVKGYVRFKYEYSWKRAQAFLVEVGGKCFLIDQSKEHTTKIKYE